MQNYDLYLNLDKPTLGLYVREGAGLPDLAAAEAAKWQREGTVPAGELPPATVRELEANGHAFQELGG